LLNGAIILKFLSAGIKGVSETFLNVYSANLKVGE